MSDRKRSRRRGPTSGLNWPLLMLLAGLVLFAIAVYTLREGQPAVAVEINGAPALRVNQEQFDLGDVKLGTKVKVEVEVSNAGDRALQITGKPYVEVVEGC